MLDEGRKCLIEDLLLRRTVDGVFLVDEEYGHGIDANTMEMHDLVLDLVHELVAVEQRCRILHACLLRGGEENLEVAEALVLDVIGSVDLLDHLILAALLPGK